MKHHSNHNGTRHNGKKAKMAHQKAMRKLSGHSNGHNGDGQKTLVLANKNRKPGSRISRIHGGGHVQARPVLARGGW